MPVKPSSEDKSPGHHHGDGPSSTVTALDPEDTAVLYGHLWQNGQDEFPMSIFPTTSDALDEERPDEVVTFDKNFLVKKHVSLIPNIYLPTDSKWNAKRYQQCYNLTDE